MDDSTIMPYGPVRSLSPPRQTSDPATRDMSPNVMRADEGVVLSNLLAMCQTCGQMALERAVFAGCGKYGHASCLQLENVFNYYFCGSCVPRVIAEYSTFQDAQRREAWRNSITTQISVWRSLAIEAIGVSSTIGIAVGGVGAAAAGAAAGLAQGAVRGAVEASASSQSALPSIPTTAIEDAEPVSQEAAQGSALFTAAAASTSPAPSGFHP